MCYYPRVTLLGNQGTVVVAKRFNAWQLWRTFFFFYDVLFFEWIFRCIKSPLILIGHPKETQRKLIYAH